MKAKDFDKKFDAGDDITQQLDLPAARRHKQDQKRVAKVSKKADPSLIDDENPEWSKEDFKKARPAAQVLREVLSKEAAEEMLKPKPVARRSS